MLNDDINALFDNELEEDEIFSGLTPAKAPPPYPGTPGKNSFNDGKLQTTFMFCHLNYQSDCNVNSSNQFSRKIFYIIM